MKAYQRKYGDENYNNTLLIYENKSKDLPAIWQMDRGHEQAFEVLYTKGPLVLKALDDRIGNKNFTRLLHELHQKKINTTQNFLKTLESICDKSTADWFETLLKK